MFLKNYYSAIDCAINNVSKSVTTCAGTTASLSIVSGSTSVANATCCNIMLKGVGTSDGGKASSLYYVQTSYASATGGIVFGDGSAPVTPDDYTLSGNIISGITASCTVSNELVDNVSTTKSIITITNGNDSDITISEVGLMAKTSLSDNAKYSFLTERTVLDTPVTIPAGGIGQVTYTIRFNYPTV